jgi:hypothetical protein
MFTTYGNAESCRKEKNEQCSKFLREPWEAIEINEFYMIEELNT